MNFIDEMKKLRKDFECQCIENGRKQDQIIELKRKLREIEEQLKSKNEEVRILKEALNDRSTNTKRK